MYIFSMTQIFLLDSCFCYAFYFFKPSYVILYISIYIYIYMLHTVFSISLISTVCAKNM